MSLSKESLAVDRLRGQSALTHHSRIIIVHYSIITMVYDSMFWYVIVHIENPQVEVPRANQKNAKRLKAVAQTRSHGGQR